MAHANIALRQHSVWKRMQVVSRLTRLDILRLAADFGCSVAAIRCDIRFVEKLASEPNDGPFFYSLATGLTWFAPLDRLALEVLERDKCRCYYCGVVAFAIDHVVPRSRGGQDQRSNLVTTCKSCNSTKGAAPLDLFNPVIRRARVQRG